MRNKSEAFEGGYRRVAGLTLIELMISVSVASILVGIAVPLAKNALAAYDLSAAVAAVSGAIQSTRYQAIAAGCQYTISFYPSSTNYQVSGESLSGTPPSCSPMFSDVGGPIPWSDSGNITMSDATTLQFSPNGSVTATTGSLVFSITNGAQTETVTVSGVGNVTLSP